MKKGGRVTSNGEGRIRIRIRIRMETSLAVERP